MRHAVCSQPEFLDGENGYCCEACKRKCRAKKQFRIAEAPRVLTIHLKRFSFSTGGSFGGTSGKISSHVQFEASRFDLAPFTVQGAAQGPLDYRLFAVLVHEGSSTSSGHYYAYARSLANGGGLANGSSNGANGNGHGSSGGSEGGWHQFNDSNVRRVSEKEVRDAAAYILLYEKIDWQPRRDVCAQERREPANGSSANGSSTNGHANGHANGSTPTIGPAPRPSPADKVYHGPAPRPVAAAPAAVKAAGGDESNGTAARKRPLDEATRDEYVAALRASSIFDMLFERVVTSKADKFSTQLQRSRGATPAHHPNGNGEALTPDECSAMASDVNLLLRSILEAAQHTLVWEILQTELGRHFGVSVSEAAAALRLPRDSVCAAAALCAKDAEQLVAAARASDWWSSERANVRKVCSPAVDSAIANLPASQRRGGRDARDGIVESGRALSVQLAALAKDPTCADGWMGMLRGVDPSKERIKALKKHMEDAYTAMVARSR